MREQHGRGVEVVEREVAVRDRVDRVAQLAGRRRDRQRRPGERTGAERRRRGLGGREGETGAVALEHLDPREQVVAERHRLRALQVRVARHRCLCLRAGALEHDLCEGGDCGGRLPAGVGDVEPKCRRDLVVARAPGVDLAADRSELPFDRGVHVLVGGIDVVDRREAFGHLGQLVVVEDARSVKPLRVQQRRLQVVRQQLGVVGEQERPCLRRELALDAAGPERHSEYPSCASIRRASVMSLILTASCPMRSEAVNAVALRSIDRRSGS